jgi:hypothetical protein
MRFIKSGTHEETSMLDKPQIAQTAAQPTAIIRLTIPREEIRNVMGPGHRELMAAVAAQGIAPARPWFTHHLRMDPDLFDFVTVQVGRNARS